MNTGSKRQELQHGEVRGPRGLASFRPVIYLIFVTLHSRHSFTFWPQILHSTITSTAARTALLPLLLVFHFALLVLSSVETLAERLGREAVDVLETERPDELVHSV